MIRVADYLKPSRDVMARDRRMNATTRETYELLRIRKTRSGRTVRVNATRTDHEGLGLGRGLGVMRGRFGISSDRDRSDACGRAQRAFA